MRILSRGRVDYSAEHYQREGDESYLQWWYFDAELSTGHHLMAILMPETFGQLKGATNGPEPIVTLVIVEPDGKNHRVRRFYPGDFEAERDRLFARFGDNTLSFEEGVYHLKLNQDGLGCDLKYRPTIKPWAPLPGSDGFMTRPFMRLMQPGLSNPYFHYVSMAPRAEVEGTIVLGGEMLSVEGAGYHEQGRTNGALTDVFHYWYWTRLFVDDWTFVFPVAKAPAKLGRVPMRALLITHKDRIVADLFDITGLILSHQVHTEMRDESIGHDLVKTATFKARTLGLSMKMQMHVGEELESFAFRYLDRQSPLQPAWLQHFMDVDVDLEVKGERHHLKGRGIFESMFSGARA